MSARVLAWLTMTTLAENTGPRALASDYAHPPGIAAFSAGEACRPGRRPTMPATQSWGSNFGGSRVAP